MLGHLKLDTCIIDETNNQLIASLHCRRLLQMGVYNAELFNNLGLCCFYAQQYDMTLTCFERALSLAEEVTLSEVWYNIGHVALVGHINTGFHSLN